MKMANEPGEKFCLRWNDFEKNISTSFSELRDDKDFFDVTLACDDNQIQAHKVILSACSSFFRSVLKKNPHQHPLLYLKGVRYEDIISVLNFMYHGEVNVAQEDLNSFLSVAEDLQVKGLTQNNQKDQQTHLKATTERKHLSESSPIPPTHRQDKQQRVRHSYEDISRTKEAIEIERDIPDPLPQIKTEASAPVIESEADDPNQMVLSSDYQGDNSGYEEYPQEYEEQPVQYEAVGVNQGMVRASSTGWTNAPKPFPCLYCSKSFSNQNSLQKHTKSHTGQTYCDICDKNFSNVPNLRAHINTVHSRA